MNDECGSILPPGTQVRVITNPSRIGTVGNKSRNQGGHLYVRVHFSDGKQYMLPEQLEAIEEEVDAVDLAEKMKFGRALDLRRNITHLRLTGRLANVIYSMEATRTDFFAHQFKPVLRFLDSPSQGLLIADEVGLGKTIEAGLIWTELRSRNDASRLLIVCPAMLREKWQRELRYRFGVEAQIVDARDMLKMAKQMQEGSLQQCALIASMPGLRRPRGWDKPGEPGYSRPSAALARFMEEQSEISPLFDLLIIDEAHYMRNPETATSRLGQQVRELSEHVVLLSATPIHLKSQDLYQLLHLIDQDTFQDARYFDEMVEVHRPLTELRDKLRGGRTINVQEFRSRLDEVLQHGMTGESRQLASLRDETDLDAKLRDPEHMLRIADRLERANSIFNVISRTLKRHVNEWRVIRQPSPEKVQMSAIERQFYNRVSEIIREACQDYAPSEAFLLAMPQRQMSSSMAAAFRAWMHRSEITDPEALYEDMGTDIEAPQEERFVVDNLRAELAGEFSYEELRRNDSKFERLLCVLRELFSNNPEAKVVLFAYFKATLWYLKERLAEADVQGAVLVGGAAIDKEATLTEFRDSPNIRILLASEVASEGIDLQFSSFLINYDLPWNPMKVEQRIGRIDRLGQGAERIDIWNILYADTIDDRIYERLLSRLQIFEAALGEGEAVIGEEIQQLTRELLTRPLSPEEQDKRIKQTEMAVKQRVQHEQDLEAEAEGLFAHGEYILNAIDAARKLKRWNTGQDIYLYASDFLQKVYRGCLIQQVGSDGEDLTFDVRLSDQARVDYGAFLKRHNWIGKSRLQINEPGNQRVRFSNKVVSDQEGIAKLEVVNQFHPLIRWIGECMKDEELRPYPVSAVRLSRSKLEGDAANLRPGLYAYAMQSWSVRGVRDSETLAFSVVALDGTFENLDEPAEVLVTSAARDGEDALFLDTRLDAEHWQSAVHRANTNMSAAFRTFARQERDANEDQVDQQLASLEAIFKRKSHVIREKIEASGPQARTLAADRKRLANLEASTRQRKLQLEQRRHASVDQRGETFGVIELME